MTKSETDKNTWAFLSQEVKKGTKIKLEPRNLTNLNFVRLEETQVGDTHGFLQNVTDEIIDDNLIHKIF